MEYLTYPIIIYILDYHVKVSVSFAVVMIAFFSSLVSMERAELSSSVRVEDKDIRLANYNLLLAAREAVEGFEVDPEDFPIEGISDDILTSSAQDLVNYFKLWCDDRIDMLIIEKGITPDMVEAEHAVSRKRLARLLSKENLENPSEEIKQEVQEVAQEMGVPTPPVFQKHGRTACVVGGSVVCYSPKKLQGLAPTPRRRKAVYAHELAHRKYEDGLHKIAIRKAFEKAKKDDEYTDDLADEISRVKETHCDFSGGSLSPEYASHFERLWNIPDTNNIARTHPLRIHRRKIAQAWKVVHQLHDEQKRRETKLFFSEAGKRLRELMSNDEEVLPKED